MACVQYLCPDEVPNALGDRRSLSRAVVAKNGARIAKHHSVSEPANTTSSRLTSTGRGGNFDPRASELERVARQSSGASSPRFGSPRAWASKASCGSGRSCCGSEIDRGVPRVSWKRRVREPTARPPDPPVNGKRNGRRRSKSTPTSLEKTRQPPQVRYASMLNINGGWWSQPSRNHSDSD